MEKQKEKRRKKRKEEASMCFISKHFSTYTYGNPSNIFWTKPGHKEGRMEGQKDRGTAEHHCTVVIPVKTPLTPPPTTVTRRPSNKVTEGGVGVGRVEKQHQSKPISLKFFYAQTKAQNQKQLVTLVKSPDCPVTHMAAAFSRNP